jgi:hypothetical protein
MSARRAVKRGGGIAVRETKSVRRAAALARPAGRGETRGALNAFGDNRTAAAGQRNSQRKIRHQ